MNGMKESLLIVVVFSLSAEDLQYCIQRVNAMIGWSTFDKFLGELEDVAAIRSS